MLISDFYQPSALTLFQKLHVLLLDFASGFFINTHVIADSEATANLLVIYLLSAQRQPTNYEFYLCHASLLSSLNR